MFNVVASRNDPCVVVVRLKIALLHWQVQNKILEVKRNYLEIIFQTTNPKYNISDMYKDNNFPFIGAL